jgi:two-component system, sensor histidine kinase and response regulator
MIKILAIEDDAMILENILEIFALEHYEVRGATDGKAGLRLAMEFVPDLIVCDVAMPEISGYDVLAELRTKPDMMTIPFIFLTAKTSRIDIRRGMNLGADDYLTKPFTAPELLAAVHLRLEKRIAIAAVYDRQLSNLRQSIVYSLPHEFRTPLFGILGFATLLMDESAFATPDEIHSMAHRIYLSAARLHKLAEHYLLYAQIELMRNDVERRASLNEVFTVQSAGTIEIAALQVAQEVQRSADLVLETVEATLRISDESLGKIVQEIVDNAFKFSDNHSPVVVVADSSSDMFSLRVIDKGHGMTAQQIGEIGAYMQFERKLYEQQGTGLGLMIAKTLVEMHGGKFSLESEREHGTTVTIRLPYATTFPDNGNPNDQDRRS